MAQVENLLAEISAMEDRGTKGRPESAGGSPLEARVRIFERLATEVARLKFYAARGKEVQFVQQLEPRMKAGVGKLQELLSKGLAQALEEGNAFTHSLPPGSCCHRTQILREVVVAPLVRSGLSAATDQSSAPSSSSSSSSFSQVLDVHATAIYEELGGLLRGIDHVQIELRLFDFLGNAVLAEVDTQLAAAMPGAFSVASSSPTPLPVVLQGLASLTKGRMFLKVAHSIWPAGAHEVGNTDDAMIITYAL
ncbi:g8777 [Coccomyxa viridis]|uniref:G8777 protein n=1 Tax=Coccomyxa viridis TaxID=1274662 RepID=A0ABP1G3T0_9CHLO